MQGDRILRSLESERESPRDPNPEVTLNCFFKALSHKPTPKQQLHTRQGRRQGAVCGGCRRSESQETGFSIYIIYFPTMSWATSWKSGLTACSVPGNQKALPSLAFRQFMRFVFAYPSLPPSLPPSVLPSLFFLPRSARDSIHRFRFGWPGN